ncbi:MAG: DNA repair protein RecO [Candidatus Methylumidiphilus sp.]
MELAGRHALREAFVLHRGLFRETSLLLDVFACDHGIVRLLAKGALRGKGGKSGVLQPFNPLGLAWTARGEPAVLTAAEALGRCHALVGKTLFCGLYLNELLLRLLPSHDPYPDLFAFYGQSLARLESGERLDEALRFFELALLEELGYGLLLDCDAGGGDIRPERHYDYRIEQGPVEAAPGPYAIPGAALLGLRDGELQGASEINAAKRLMRRVILHHLGGKPLKSRELFKFTQTTEAK